MPPTVDGTNQQKKQKNNLCVRLNLTVRGKNLSKIRVTFSPLLIDLMKEIEYIIFFFSYFVFCNGIAIHKVKPEVRDTYTTRSGNVFYLLTV